MHHDNSMRRLRCDRCCRPVSLCLCEHLAPVQSRTHVLVLQHPEEAKHALSTARLAVLGLPNSQLWVGEHFPDLPEAIMQCSTVFLLFPGEGAVQPKSLSELDAHGPCRTHRLKDANESRSTCGSEETYGSPEPYRSKGVDNSALLIVPDGTWRKAGKILHRNPVLQTLPRLALRQGEPSRYRIRKAPHTAAVSTIEAIVRTLSALEPERDFTPLLQPFDALIEQQIRAMGPDIYAKNHQRGM